MSQEPSTVEVTRSSLFSSRIGNLVDSRRAKMFGLAEVAALVVSGFVLFLVLLSYLYFYLPARSRYNSLIQDHERSETNIKKLRDIASKGQSSKDTVNQVTTSLTSFEDVALTRQDSGRLALYDELNQTILKNNLKNTSGPTYTVVDPTGTKATPGKAVNTKWQSYYPGLAVMVTVEGSYQNLRHFIQDIERSKQFLIINEVELQRATEHNLPSSAEAAATEGSKNSQVSLQLGLATYFRRGTDVPASQE